MGGRPVGGPVGKPVGEANLGACGQPVGEYLPWINEARASRNTSVSQLVGTIRPRTATLLFTQGKIFFAVDLRPSPICAFAAPPLSPHCAKNAHRGKAFFENQEVTSVELPRAPLRSEVGPTPAATNSNM